jgi:hypothetical protein
MTGGRRRLAAVVGAVAVLVLAAGCDGGGPRAGYAGVSSTTPTQAPTPEAKGLDAARGFRSTRGYRPTPVPVRLDIPRIRVSTSLQRLGRDGHGAVAVPRGPHQWEQAGWYAPGTRPGDPGSAVILGHVDSKAGPAVFARLGELEPGDAISVIRADGSAVHFGVERTEQYPKRRFPTDEVYYPTLTPQLRLVTCGGAFDRAWGHYRDNVIVFATLKP